jgi:hypothetical protein
MSISLALTSQFFRWLLYGSRDAACRAVFCSRSRAGIRHAFIVLTLIMGVLLLALLSALVAAIAAGLAVKKTLGRWVS